MKTLEEEEESTERAARLALPTEIIDDILSRLPAKSILRFRSVSKPWLSRISDPSFTKLQFTRATPALFISAFDLLTRKHHFLSAAPDGGPVTHLITFDDDPRDTFVTEAEHLNGLVCFITSKDLVSKKSRFHACVFNPSTRQIFTVPDPFDCSKYAHLGYLFGFDESRNEHKVLLIRKHKKSSKIEFMIYSLSNHSWRNINVEPPTAVGFSWDRLSFITNMNGGVCVDSVVYVMLMDFSYDILAVDLKTNKLEIISIPEGFVPEVEVYQRRNGESFLKDSIPFVMKINGCVGVVCPNHDGESHGVYLCILQDYDNRVWVRETIKFPNESGSEFGYPFDVNMDEIISSAIQGSGNVIWLPVYNMKTGCSKSVCFTLEDQFLRSETVKFNHIKWYAESIMPL